MTTKVTFETATLADSLKKAALVAPSKGAAFDQAAGIIMEVTPSSFVPTLIRATDTKIYYSEVVDTVSAEGEDVVWRFPSIVAAVIASLPIGSGKEVTLETINNSVRITQGRTKAKVNLLDHGYFPSWEPFDPDNLQEVSALGERIKQVQWAAATSTNTEPLNGIHFDGKRIICTDKYRIALAECEMPIDSPVTVPAGILGSVIRQMGDTKIGTSADMMLLMPDEHTQIKAVLLGHAYPNIDRIISRPMDASVPVRKDALLEIIGRANTMTGNERFPTLRVFIGGEEIAVVLNNESMGLLGDVVEVPGHALHERTEIRFTPKNLTDAIAACPNDNITIQYNINAKQPMVVIDGGSGYNAWVMGRVDKGVTQDA